MDLKNIFNVMPSMECGNQNLHWIMFVCVCVSAKRPENEGVQKFVLLHVRRNKSCADYSTHNLLMQIFRRDLDQGCQRSWSMLM